MNYLDSNHMHYHFELKDYGGEPFTVNIKRAAMMNKNYRLALWSGYNLQLTLMNINIGESIGMECHEDVDQLLCVESGYGSVIMGRQKDKMDYKQTIMPNSVIVIPAKTWHDVINTSNMPLKLFSVYALPEHPKGTVQKTKADASHE